MTAKLRRIYWLRSFRADEIANFAFDSFRYYFMSRYLRSHSIHCFPLLHQQNRTSGFNWSAHGLLLVNTTPPKFARNALASRQARERGNHPINEPDPSGSWASDPQATFVLQRVEKLQACNARGPIKVLSRSLRRPTERRGRSGGPPWRRGIEWTAAMGQFAIAFGSRFPGSAR